MDSTRQQKISRLIQKELSIIFQRKSNMLNKSLISVTTVRTAPDLSTAKAYLSIFPTNNIDEVFSLIQKNTKTIRHELAQITRNQLRKIPELSFFIDDSLDYAEKIENLLKK